MQIQDLIHEHMFTQPLCLHVLINMCNMFLSHKKLVRAENSYCLGRGGCAVYQTSVVVECHLVMLFLTTAWCEMKHISQSPPRPKPLSILLIATFQCHFTLCRRHVLSWFLPQIAYILLGDVMMRFYFIYLYLCCSP